eukprot:GAHX01004070.1.p1 GENE.GAHX01004070.1~~GAHX01004070.1.p1  ORF type:complete len:488 (-),score=58.37 GAHX01004070.1:28-1491(-)
MADATHGTNLYGFKLIIFGRLIRNISFAQILYIISDKESEETCTNVLRQFKESTKIDINARFFMSDMSPIFLNSWNNVFTQKPQWYYCCWHLKKAVRRQLNSKIKCEEDRNKIQTMFEKLTKINDEAAFKRKLKRFENLCDRISEDFGSYFKKYYSSTYKRWSLHTRLECFVNTNMFVEAYFGEFKRNYLFSKSKYRLDFLFNALIIYENHKHIVSLRQKASKQQQHLGYRAVVAQRRHNASKHLKFEKFKLSDCKKSVKYKQYTIIKGTCRDCTINCKVLCNECGICMYRHQCTCLSYESRKELCKHIHVAHSLFMTAGKKRNLENKDLSLYDPGIQELNESHDYIDISSGYNTYYEDEPVGVSNVLERCSESGVASKDKAFMESAHSPYTTPAITNELVIGNQKQEDKCLIKLREEIFESMEDVKRYVKVVEDKTTLKRIGEEIILLQAFIKTNESKNDSNTVLDIDIDMLKKQKHSELIIVRNK